MNTTEIIQNTERFIESRFRSEGSGHDWFHVDRVRKNGSSDWRTGRL